MSIGTDARDTPVEPLGQNEVHDKMGPQLKTAPATAPTVGSRGLTPKEEGLMTIIIHPEPRRERNPRTGHADGCPACVSAVAEPWRVVTEGTGTREHYECPSCCYRWHTSWFDGPVR